MPKYQVHVEYLIEIEADSADEAECMVEDSDVPAGAEVLDIDAAPMPGESSGNSIAHSK